MLVSVIVCTYNSSKFIIECLESISKQTWKEIELVVSDDFSKDNTIDICEEWIRKNNSRFINIVVLKSHINRGISTNANRGLGIAQGSWIKYIGADDSLLSTCIEDNMSWVNDHPDIKVLFSKVKVYENNFNENNLVKLTPGYPYSKKSIFAYGITPDVQYNMLLNSDRIHFSPSVFLHRKTLVSLGGFDERFRLLEDYPLWLNLTRNGIKLHYMDKTTVKYRIHQDAINNKGLTHLVNPNYFEHESFRKIYIYPNVSYELKLYYKLKWVLLQVFRFRIFNKNIWLNRLLFSLLSVYINPLTYFIFVKKKLKSY